MRGVVLVVDDDPAHVAATAEIVERIGFEAITAGSGEEGIEILRGDAGKSVDVVVTDLVMQGRSGLDVIAHIARSGTAWERPEVIVITGYGSDEAAPVMVRAGASAELTKPLSVKLFREVLQGAVQRVRGRRRPDVNRTPGGAAPDFAGMIGRSPGMQRVFDLILRVADASATVLIEGASGTGKELVARALHGGSRRAAGPFVAVNCAALSPGLLDSELFGHERGAFTGAESRRIGRIEAADGGTLFLDEVGEMDPHLQAKLLRALEQREVVRVGSNVAIPVDVRLVAATNCDLRRRVSEGAFREDLFFRLNVVRVQLPPLRERVEDIPLLIDAFLEELAAEHGRPALPISEAAIEVLQAHSWPGNIRELRNCVEMLLLTAVTERIEPGDLPPEMQQGSAAPPPQRLSMRPLQEVERELIANTLREVSGNRARAARILGISARTLYRRIKELGL
ncbi:MAG: sigma-54-dependent transcriptional regulator [Planctomycetota bacterium]